MKIITEHHTPRVDLLADCGCAPASVLDGQQPGLHSALAALAVFVGVTVFSLRTVGKMRANASSRRRLGTVRWYLANQSGFGYGNVATRFVF
ncbi:MAG: hypothetical protein HUU55_03375 [Myxococcales bacterium]|nr:hypothetical protein [Myxococcales bacterium]